MSKDNGTTSPSKIEIAKALRNVRSVVTPEQYEKVHEIIGSGCQEELARTVGGLGEEDEFGLLCVLMGTCTQLAPLEQKHSIAIGTAAPDFLVCFQPGISLKGIPSHQHSGYKCLVEVKGTSQDRFRISGGQLRKLRSFADTFGLPLVFAVRFLRFNKIALWVIVEDTDRRSHSLTVDVSNLVGGLRSVLWNEYGYMLMPGTYFQATYTPDITGRGVRDPEYGELLSLQIVTDKQRFSLTGDDASIALALCEAYGLEEVKSQKDGKLTHVAYRARNLMVSIADLIYSINHLPRDEKGRLAFDAGRALRQLADGHSPCLITREFVEYYADKLRELGALGIIEYGRPEETYKKWLATGGMDLPK